MSFELINVTTSCQELLNNTLKNYSNIFVIIYLNDILIFSQTKKQYEQHIKKMLKCLSKRNLLIRSEKCDWHKKKIDFLGFMIEINDVRMNFDKLTSIKTWSVFINVKKVKIFLIFVNYNRKFIQEYSQKIMTFTNLIIKNRSWKWNEDEQTAFEKLRNVYLNNLILRMIDMNSSIKIKTDASDLIIEIFFNQQIDNKWHSATYFSRKLSSTEQNYNIHDKKLLIIIAVLKHWRIYTKDALNLNIYINHKNLLQFIIIKKLNRQQVRWAEELKRYKFKIHYISE